MTKDYLDGLSLIEYIEKRPHNLKIELADLEKLILLVRRVDSREIHTTTEHLVNTALFRHGGTIVEALIRTLWNS